MFRKVLVVLTLIEQILAVFLWSLRNVVEKLDAEGKGQGD
jgi:hypothetical protein